MGTSGSSKGSGSNTPLVPSWLDKPDTGPHPGGDEATPPDDGGGDDDQGAQPVSQEGNQKPDITPALLPKRFQSARTNFSRFAGSGGSNRRALRRAVRDYVRNGTRGSRNAVRRMGMSRAAAGKALGVFRSIQRVGLPETLRRLNLQNLSGRSVQDVFLGLTEVICPDSGLIDEAIARDAWLETIAEMDQFGIEDLGALSPEQIKEVFLSFIGHTIELRLYQEIGVNGFRFSEGMNDIEGFDRQFRDYIERAVRDSFTGDLTQLSAMSDMNIKVVVDKTYLEAWQILETIGDREA